MEGMNAEPLKVVQIGEHEYRIGRFSSQTGSWLLMRFIKLFRDLIKDLEDDGTEPKPDDGKGDTQEFSESLLQTLLSELDFEDFVKIQRYALLVVSRTDMVGEREFQQPIILGSGQFAIRELKEDVGAVMALTSQTIFANLAPFFTKTGLKAMMRGEIPAFNR